MMRRISPGWAGKAIERTKSAEPEYVGSHPDPPCPSRRWRQESTKPRESRYPSDLIYCTRSRL